MQFSFFLSFWIDHSVYIVLTVYHQHISRVQHVGVYIGAKHALRLRKKHFVR
jgi:hypothetical protein